MKIISFYLPQFHCIPENDEWWGKGFTEWVNMKKAKPLFEGHYQPRIPLNKNYYNLLDIKNIEWQVSLAKQYGIYGFCFYHYWFDGHMLLEKPVELYRDNPNLDLNYCICWANEHWTQAWVSKENRVLIEQKYGGEKEWTAHFNYLLEFFKDRRYIKMNDKPVLVLYKPELIDCLEDMLNHWTKLAKANGFPGIHYMAQHPSYFVYPQRNDDLFDNFIEYQPVYATTMMNSNKHSSLRKMKRKLSLFAEKKMKINLWDVGKKSLTQLDYSTIWEYICSLRPATEKNLPGAFVDWDNTPRREERGTVYVGCNPDVFKKYLSEQIRNARENYRSDYLFMFAWNEWAEGGYLEPDEKYEYKMLEAVRQALIENGEYPY